MNIYTTHTAKSRACAQTDLHISVDRFLRSVWKVKNGPECRTWYCNRLQKTWCSSDEFGKFARQKCPFGSLKAVCNDTYQITMISQPLAQVLCVPSALMASAGMALHVPILMTAQAIRVPLPGAKATVLIRESTHIRARVTPGI